MLYSDSRFAHSLRWDYRYCYMTTKRSYAVAIFDRDNHLMPWGDMTSDNLYDFLNDQGVRGLSDINWDYIEFEWGSENTNILITEDSTSCSMRIDNIKVDMGDFWLDSAINYLKSHIGNKYTSEKFISDMELLAEDILIA